MTRTDEKFANRAGTVYNNVRDYTRPRNNLSIHMAEHWAIVGPTGKGKTVFAVAGLMEYLRLQFPNAKRYILDSTSDPDMFDHVDRETGNMVPGLVYAPLEHASNTVPGLLKNSAHTLVWSPPVSKLPKQYAAWFNQLNDAHEEQIVLIDEVSSITKDGLDGLETMLKQFRKHGGIAIILSQAIAGVDTTVFSQMTHYVQFQLGYERYDTSMSKRYLAVPDDNAPEPRYDHGFFYRKVRGGHPYREYRDFKEFFGNSIRYRK